MASNQHGSSVVSPQRGRRLQGPRSPIPSGEAAAAKPKSLRLWMLGLALLAFAVHAPGILASFVFDDVVTIVHRSPAQWSRIPRFFLTNQSAIFGSNFYRPVLYTWYEVFYRFFGAHAAPWHGLSILLHVACTLLVFRLALVLLEMPSGKPSAAGMAAALFAVHPAHVEAISWASAMGDSLMTMFLLLSVLAFLRWMERGKLLWWVASFAAGTACVLTKEPGVVLPVLLLVSALALRSRAKSGRPASAAGEPSVGACQSPSLVVVLAATLPFFAITFVFLLLRRSVLGAFAHSVTEASTAQMIFTWPPVLLFYLRHMVCPPVVSPYYPLSIVQSWRSWEFFRPLIELAAAAGAFGYLLWRAAGWRNFCVCLGWILAPLAPVFYLKALAPFELVHDRFLYAPLVGFCMAAALVLQWGSDWIAARLEWNVLPLVAVFLLALMSVESWKQMLWWQNNLTLFTRAVMVAPGSSHALAGLAASNAAVGRYDQATQLLQRALAVDPEESPALYASLARVTLLRGDYDGAEKYLIDSIAAGPRADTWLDLAALELNRNKVDAAETAARQSLAIDPTIVGAHAVLGAVLLARGDQAGAASEYQQELRIDPQSKLARQGLARAAAAPPR